MLSGKKLTKTTVVTELVDFCANIAVAPLYSQLSSIQKKSAQRGQLRVTAKRQGEKQDTDRFAVL